MVDTARVVRVQGPRAFYCGGMISVTIDLELADISIVTIAEDFLRIDPDYAASVPTAEREQLRDAAVSAAHECLASYDESLGPLRLHLVCHGYSVVDTSTSTIAAAVRRAFQAALKLLAQHTPSD